MFWFQTCEILERANKYLNKLMIANDIPNAFSIKISKVGFRKIKNKT